MRFEDTLDIEEALLEMNYAGNIGIHELSTFYQKANNSQKMQLKNLIRTQKWDDAWDLIYQVTGMRIRR